MTVRHPSPPVLHLIASTDRRGAETAAVELAVALEEFGWPSLVVALEPGRWGGLDVPVLGAARYSPSTLRNLRRAGREASIVIAHGSSTLPAAAAAMVGTNVPFIYRSIGDPAAWATTTGRRLRVTGAAARADAVVALWRGSAVTWHEVLHVRAERIVVIPNAVRASDFAPASTDEQGSARANLGLDPNTPLALVLGALSPEKRVDLAIEAVASCDGLDLAVVGDGSERRRLESLAAATGGSRVHILGRVERPQLALAAADVLVIPSDTEGQPAVAIEAGLSGLPVVATNVGGLNDIVCDGTTGLLVPPGDSQQLALAIEAALTRRDELGRAARAYCASRFDLPTVADAWSRLIASIIAV